MFVQPAYVLELLRELNFPKTQRSIIPMLLFLCRLNYHLQNRLYPTSRNNSISVIQQNRFSINKEMNIPNAIQKSIKPASLFMSVPSIPLLTIFYSRFEKLILYTYFTALSMASCTSSFFVISSFLPVNLFTTSGTISTIFEKVS